MSTHYNIKKVAVLGSGVMGSRIACLFANIGLEVILLDMPTEGKNRNAIADGHLKAAISSNPAPLYKKEFASRIKTGNFDDNLSDIKSCQWTIEVVVENLNIKKSIFEKVEKFRTPGSLITSNTSGIPIELLIDGRSEDFCLHFCGTHFFNPPRYLRLFEIIPSTKTKKEVLDFFENYALLYLGKTPIQCHDTPAFIANRVGVFSMMTVFHLSTQMGLSIEDVDMLTGPLTGKPKSASFRTADVVGIDTLVKVAQGVSSSCPHDESIEIFNIPDYVDFLVKSNFLGDKTNQGFYKKTKSASGTEILVLNTKTLEYQAQNKSKFASVGAAKPEDNLKKRLLILQNQTDVAAEFLKQLNYQIFHYISFRIPEIADNLYSIDEAMKAGFGWEIGPFALWDLFGVKPICDDMKSKGISYAPWVDDFLAAGNTSFYQLKNGQRSFYDIASKQYLTSKSEDNFLILDNIRSTNTVWNNTGCNLIDLGEGILCVEFNTKMNAIGGEIIEGIHKAIDMAEGGQFRGIVLGNEAPNFSAGANLGLIYMMALEQEFDELNMVIRQFQNAVMRLRYSSIPVVAAPHGLTLGGGCEMTMHCDASISAAETYIGLVEVGVGLIPGGGGTKEMALRTSDLCLPTDPFIPKLSDRFTAIATAKTATSAYEGYDIGVLIHTKDEVCINAQRLILEAKNKAIELAKNGYTTPIPRSDIYVLGRQGLGALYAGVEGFEIGGYASAHDKKIAQKLAYIMCGGDLSSPSMVTEQYLLDLEREAFLSLLGEKKTLERIQSILTKGKPLRN